LGALVPLGAALLIALAALRWPRAWRPTPDLRRYRPAAEGPMAALTARLPGPVQWATWERHLHGWRRIGRLVVLLTLALGAAIGHGLVF